MNYAQVFQDSYGNLPPVVRAIAQGMDEQEEWLERIRIKLGFREDWSPSYDRRMKSGTSAAIKWADKAGGLNGMGDLRSLLEEMCAWMDLLEVKKAEIAAKLAPTIIVEPAIIDRLLTADEMMTAIRRDSAAYDAADHGMPEIPMCPKCGKTGRGLAMHMKSCAGKAA